MDTIREEIRENIDYAFLLADKPEDENLLDGYVELMTEVCCSNRETVHICRNDLPAEAVRSCFLALERSHIEYVRDCLKNADAKIGNIKAYTLATRYNAPLTMNQYYDALLARDVAQGNV